MYAIIALELKKKNWRSTHNSPRNTNTSIWLVFPSTLSRRAVISYWRKYVHEVLVNRLGGLSLSRKSVIRLTDRLDMTLDVYRGRKTTMQQRRFGLFSGILCKLNFNKKEIFALLNQYIYRQQGRVALLFHSGYPPADPFNVPA